MIDNHTAKEIENGFNVMAGGIREAGKRQIIKEAEKKGYIAFRKPEAVAMFHSNLDYIDWTCKFVDGEYRFYPPKKTELVTNKETPKLEQTPMENTLQTKDIVDIYKKAKSDPNTTIFVSVSGMSNKQENVIYRLIATDKKTGKSRILQNLEFSFDGQFYREILPSIYNQMINGIPAEEFEKEIGPNQNHLVISNYERNQVMGFSNITKKQVELIKQMKDFVDDHYINVEPEQSSRIKH